MNDLILYITKDGRSQYSEASCQGILYNLCLAASDTNYLEFFGS